jgi:malate dehydrogenase (oxaloacetate-decarboxylating)
LHGSSADPKPQAQALPHTSTKDHHIITAFTGDIETSSETMSVNQPHSSEHKGSNPDAKHPKFGHLPLSTSGPQDCALTGTALLHTPYLNKGAAFPSNERREFKLTGLLPQHVATLEEQTKRAYQQYSSRQDDLAKNTFMTSLAEQNQVLYFSVSG